MARAKRRESTEKETTVAEYLGDDDAPDDEEAAADSRGAKTMANLKMVVWAGRVVADETPDLVKCSSKARAALEEFLEEHVNFYGNAKADDVTSASSSLAAWALQDLAHRVKARVFTYAYAATVLEVVEAMLQDYIEEHGSEGYYRCA